MVQQGDRAAAQKVQDDGLRSGNCLLVRGDTLVFGAAIDNNQVVMVRSRGEPTELWTLASMLPHGIIPIARQERGPTEMATVAALRDERPGCAGDDPSRAR